MADAAFFLLSRQNVLCVARHPMLKVCRSIGPVGLLGEGGSDGFLRGFRWNAFGGRVGRPDCVVRTSFHVSFIQLSKVLDWLTAPRS